MLRRSRCALILFLTTAPHLNETGTDNNLLPTFTRPKLHLPPETLAHFTNDLALLMYRYIYNRLYMDSLTTTWYTWLEAIKTFALYTWLRPPWRFVGRLTPIRTIHLRT
ncbi:unnamed protein product [Ascophyllum nodosum]